MLLFEVTEPVTEQTEWYSPIVEVPKAKWQCADMHRPHKAQPSSPSRNLSHANS